MGAHRDKTAYARRGSAMAWAVVSALLLMVVVLSLLTLSQGYARRTVNSNAEKQAYLTALSAVDAICARIQADNPLPAAKAAASFDYSSLNMGGLVLYGQTVPVTGFDFPETMGECIASVHCGTAVTEGETTTVTLQVQASATVGKCTETLTRTLELVTEKTETVIVIPGEGSHWGDPVELDEDFWQTWLKDADRFTDDNYNNDHQKCYAVPLRVGGNTETIYIFEDCAGGHGEGYHTEDCYKVCSNENHSSHYKSGNSDDSNWLQGIRRAIVWWVRHIWGMDDFADFLELLWGLNDNGTAKEHKDSEIQAGDPPIYEWIEAGEPTYETVYTYTTQWGEDHYARA